MFQRFLIAAKAGFSRCEVLQGHDARRINLMPLLIQLANGQASDVNSAMSSLDTFIELSAASAPEFVGLQNPLFYLVNTIGIP